MQIFIFRFRSSDMKCNFLLFNFDLVTPELKYKSLIFELVTRRLMMYVDSASSNLNAPFLSSILIHEMTVADNSSIQINIKRSA